MSCKDCALLLNNHKECPFFGGIPEVECTMFTSELKTCELCGRLIIGVETLDITNGTARAICNNCFNNLHSCAICDNGKVCEFKTNPSPIPRTIQKQIRQGNAIMIQQVPNPERIQAFCINCKCYHEETCYKNQGCVNHNIRYRNES